MAAGVELHRKRVLVVGAGVTGWAVVRFACSRDAVVTIVDQKSAEELEPTRRAFIDGGNPADVAGGFSARFGGFHESDFTSAELIVVSPGVPLITPELVAAQHAGVAILGEVELAARFIDAPIVAITGTNGKSTVTALCGEIAAATGRPTFVGGNFGTPLIEVVGTDAATPRGIVVCECSSFQLESCDMFHPRAAVLLNITPDHLDRYGSMTEYADAKLRVIRNLQRGDVFVMNEDDPMSLAAYQRHVGGWLPTLTYSTRGRPQHRFVQASGDGVVETDAGGFVDGTDLVVRLADPAGRVTEERYAAADLALVGRHNLGNALAAYLAMRGAGLATPSQVREGARRFRPLAHRMELVGERRGVRFYDDSKGTNVAAVVASIDGFPRPFILIAGGRDKGGSYAPLRDALARNIVRAVVLIGEAADKIASAVEGVTTVRRAASMGDAVLIASELAADGDAVVLSPACSSYDIFRDYAHRGDVFREAVENLPDPA